MEHYRAEDQSNVIKWTNFFAIVTKKIILNMQIE